MTPTREEWRRKGSCGATDVFDDVGERESVVPGERPEHAACCHVYAGDCGDLVDDEENGEG